MTSGRPRASSARARSDCPAARSSPSARHRGSENLAMLHGTWPLLTAQSANVQDVTDDVPADRFPDSCLEKRLIPFRATRIQQRTERLRCVAVSLPYSYSDLS